jgi:hypothetical protein
MNGLRPASARRLQDLSAVEIALAGRRRPYPKSPIRKRDVHGAAIRLRIDGGGCDSKPPRRSYDAASDLTPIGNEDLRKHAGYPFNWERLPDEPLVEFLLAATIRPLNMGLTSLII